MAVRTKSGIWWSLISTHDGKMKFVPSISTSPLLNSGCAHNQSIEGCVCHDCYSVVLNEFRKSLREKLARNHEVLTSRLLTLEEIDSLDLHNARICRFEAFGDINNITQVENYINIAKHFPLTEFGWWTKQPEIIKESGLEIPENVHIVYSFHGVDVPVDVVEIAKAKLKERFPFIEKFFIVEREPSERTNCQGVSCIKCQKCYHSNGIDTLWEVLR